MKIMREKHRNLYVSAAALMSAYALLADFAADKAEISGGGITRLLLALQNAIGGKGFLLSVLALGLFCLYDRLSKYCSTGSKSFIILPLILSFLTILYYPYVLEDSFSLLWCSKFQIVQSLLFLCGYFFLFHFTVTALFYYLEEQRKNIVCRQSVSYIKIIVKLAVLWLPHFIIKFPGAFTADTISQIRQGLWLEQFSSHHPPFHTFMIKMCLLVGKKIFHSYNAGTFLYISCQYLAMVSVFGYTIYYLEKKGIPAIIKYTIWSIYGVCPLIVGYIGVAVKDTVYAIFFTVFVIFCVRFLDDRENPLSHINMLGLVMSGILTTLVRNNGKEVIYPVLFLIAIITIWKNKKNVKQIVKACILFAAPVVLSMLISKALVAHYNIIPGSRGEMFSLPFQQTARTVLEHSEQIPLKERQAIDRILKYDTLAERYQFHISDPVKKEYNVKATYREHLDYVKVWISQFIRYPITYFDATLSQNYPLFCLLVDNIHYYYKSGVEYEEQVIIYGYPFLERIEETVVLFYENLHNIPIMNLISNSSFYCILLLVLTVFVWRNKKYDFLIALFPLWLTVVCCILGPVIIRSPRYTFPIVYTIPFLLGAYACKTELS